MTDRTGQLQPGDKPSALPDSQKRGLRNEAHSDEMIEVCLWEVAICGGNVAKAHDRLKTEWMDHGRDPSELPYPETIRGWKRGKWRNRYHEIVNSRSRELEEIVAGRQLEKAIALEDAEDAALRQVTAGISNLDAVEASTVLRNLSQAKKTAVDATVQLRRGHSDVTEDNRTIAALADALERLGVGRRHHVDGEAQEITEAQLGEGEEPPTPPASVTA